jgi:HSP20 family protein
MVINGNKKIQLIGGIVMSKFSPERKALVSSYRPLNIIDVCDSLSQEIWDSWSPFDSKYSLIPGSEIYEDKGHLVMKAELPGIDIKDLQISLEGDRLTIKAEKKEEVKIKKRPADSPRETYYSQYFRSLTLPYPVKEDQIKATFDKGILELRLPKGEASKPRKIEIKPQLAAVETKKLNAKTKRKS